MKLVTALTALAVSFALPAWAEPILEGHKFKSGNDCEMQAEGPMAFCAVDGDPLCFTFSQYRNPQIVIEKTGYATARNIGVVEGRYGVGKLFALSKTGRQAPGEEALIIVAYPKNGSLCVEGRLEYRGEQI